MVFSQIHLIEIMPKLLYTAFDDEFCDEVSQVLVEKGIKLYTDSNGQLQSLYPKAPPRRVGPRQPVEI